jgi:hypothetical protein
VFYTLPDRPNLMRGSADTAHELVQEFPELIASYLGVYRATRHGVSIVVVYLFPVGTTHDLEAEEPIVVTAML